MSMPASPGAPTPPQGTAGSTDIITTLQGVVRQLSAVRQSMNSVSKLLGANNTWTGTNVFTKGVTASSFATLLQPSGDVTGATDVTNINAAIATAQDTITGFVFLPKGNWYINATISIPDNIVIEGAGGGYNQSLQGTGTSITMVGLNAPAFKVFTALGRTRSWGLGNLSIQTPATGNTSANGLYVDGGSIGYVHDVLVAVNGASQIGILFNSTSASGQASQQNTFDRVSIYLGPVANAVGMKLTSDGSGPDASVNSFNNLTILSNSVASHIQLWLAACDTNYFNNYIGYSFAPTALTAIKFDYSVNADWPANNQFYGLDIGYNITSGASAIVVTGSPSSFAFTNSNLMYGFGVGNGAMLPINNVALRLIGNENSVSSLLIRPYSASTNATISLIDSAALGDWQILSTYSAGAFDIFDGITGNVPISVAPTTDIVTLNQGGIAPFVEYTPVAYASLPSPSFGMVACVNNSSVNTWGGTADGAGSDKVLCWYNGAAWSIIGK